MKEAIETYGTRPQYRLRVGEMRVFYDINDTIVEILAIVAKSEASKWLDEAARSNR